MSLCDDTFLGRGYAELMQDGYNDPLNPFIANEVAKAVWVLGATGCSAYTPYMQALLEHMTAAQDTERRRKQAEAAARANAQRFAPVWYSHRQHRYGG
jgi:hypothetical protein